MKIDDYFKMTKRKKEEKLITFVMDNIYFSDEVDSRFSQEDYENWVSLLDKEDKEKLLFKLMESYDLVWRVKNYNSLEMKFGRNDYDFKLWINTDDNKLKEINKFANKINGGWNVSGLSESSVSSFQKGVPVFLKKWNDVEDISQYMRYLKPLDIEVFNRELGKSLDRGSADFNNKVFLLGKELADIYVMMAPLNEIAENFINKNELKNYLLEGWNSLEKKDEKYNISELLYLLYIESLSKVFEPAVLSDKYVDVFNEKMKKFTKEMEESKDRENHWDFGNTHIAKEIIWIKDALNTNDLFKKNIHRLDFGDYKNSRSVEELNGEYIIKYNAKKIARMMFLLNEFKYVIAKELKLDYPSELNNYLHLENAMNNKMYYRDSIDYFLKVVMGTEKVSEDKINSITFPRVNDNEGEVENLDEIKNLVFKIPASEENKALLDIVAQAYMVGSMIASGEYLMFTETLKNLLLDWNMKKDAGFFKDNSDTVVTSKRKIKW